MKVGDISKYAFAFVVQNQSSSVVLLPPGKVTEVTINVEHDVRYRYPRDYCGRPEPYDTGGRTLSAKVSGKGISDFTVTQVMSPMVRGSKPWSIAAQHGEIFDVRGTGRTDKGLDVAFRIWIPNEDLMEILFGQELPDIFARPMSPASGTLFASTPSNALAAPVMRALE